MNRLGKLILVSLLLGGLIGCALNQPIRYKISDITPSTVTQLKDVTLSVELFTDNRRSVSENEIVFLDGRDTNISGKIVSDEGQSKWIPGKRVCINSEKHYKKEPVAKQITEAIVAHLKQRGAFKHVLVNSEAPTDFQLQGAIRQFYGQQDYSYWKAGAEQLWQAGAIATMRMKSQGIIKIEFTDLKLVDKNGTLVRTLKDVSKTFEGQFLIDAYCWRIYEHTNLKLKEVVDALADDIEKNLSDIIANEPEKLNDVTKNK
jgi:phenylpyruvate tautomerase PptA (4-oxalocrotonate tautomerase family)